MPASTQAQIRALYRYPVKGLSGERLQSVEVGRHQTFPNDRAYALENGPSGFDPAAPRWAARKPSFFAGCGTRALPLSTRCSRTRSETLTVRSGPEVLLRESFATASGRHTVEQFFETFMEDEKRGPVRLLKAPDHSFSDLAKKVVSLINLSTVVAFEERVGKPVHPLRFRG